MTSNYENPKGIVDYLEVYDGPLSAVEVEGMYRRAPARLAIAIAGNKISIAWTNLIFGSQLETTATLSPTAVWQNVTNLPVINGLNYTIAVSNQPATRRAFYRLRQF